MTDQIQNHRIYMYFMKFVLDNIKKAARELGYVVI